MHHSPDRAEHERCQAHDRAAHHVLLGLTLFPLCGAGMDDLLRVIATKADDGAQGGILEGQADAEEESEGEAEEAEAGSSEEEAGEQEAGMRVGSAAGRATAAASAPEVCAACLPSCGQHP